MPPQFYHRDNCRLCRSKNVVLALKLKPTAIADAYIPKEKTTVPQPLYPLDLYLCADCGHAQLLDVIPPHILFEDYIYVSASSLNLDQHFKQYADDVMKWAQLKPGNRVLDIGSNDGTLLRFFKEKGLRVLGADPARDIARKATDSGVRTIPEFFSSQLSEKIRSSEGSFDLITANNVYAHSDQLGDMTDGIKNLLSPEGVFVFEVSYLMDLMEGMVFDYIYHEHLCHHSVKPLKKFLAAHGLELIDVVRVPTKGGSLRCMAQLKGGGKNISPIVETLIKAEDSYGLDKISAYQAFNKKIDHAKIQLLDYLDERIKSGKKIAGFGASATSTTLIYHFDLGDKLSCIYDDNIQRHNLYSPGFHIPVVSPSEIERRKTDDILLLAWRYEKPILAKHRDFLKKGGRFILPLPSFKVVT